MTGSSDNLLSVGCSSTISESPPELILFVMPGSQFCIKVMAYMNLNEMSYKVQWVRDAKKELAAPHLVPALLNIKGGGEMVHDSSMILAYLDDKLNKEQLSGVLNAPAFPTSSDQVYGMEKYMDSYFNCYIKYLNMIDEKGFAASIGALVNARIPWFLRTILPCWFSARKIVDASGITAKYLKDIEANIDKDVLNGGDAKVRSAFTKLLVSLSDVLKKTKYGFLTNSKMPSAGDFALYGILEHLVGYSGWELPPAWPEALDKENTVYVRTFFDKMQTMCKIKFDFNNRVGKGVNMLPSQDVQAEKDGSAQYAQKRTLAMENAYTFEL